MGQGRDTVQGAVQLLQHWKRRLPFEWEIERVPVFEVLLLHSTESDGAENGGIGTASSRTFRKHIVSFMRHPRRGVIAALHIGPRGAVSCVTYGNTVRLAFRATTHSLTTGTKKCSRRWRPSERGPHCPIPSPVPRILSFFSFHRKDR